MVQVRSHSRVTPTKKVASPRIEIDRSLANKGLILFNAYMDPENAPRAKPADATISHIVDVAVKCAAGQSIVLSASDRYADYKTCTLLSTMNEADIYHLIDDIVHQILPWHWWRVSVSWILDRHEVHITLFKRSKLTVSG